MLASRQTTATAIQSRRIVRFAARGAHVARRSDRFREIRYENRDEQADTYALSLRQADTEHGLLRNAVQEGP